MKTHVIFRALLCLLIPYAATAQDYLDLGFEDSTHAAFCDHPEYPYRYQQAIRYEGRLALRLQGGNETNAYPIMLYKNILEGKRQLTIRYMLYADSIAAGGMAGIEVSGSRKEAPASLMIDDSLSARHLVTRSKQWYPVTYAAALPQGLDYLDISPAIKSATGFACFDKLEVLLDGQPVNQLLSLQKMTDADRKQLLKEAIPFPTGLSRLQPILAGAEVIGAGEATHGSSECFSIKYRLFRYLVEHMGYTIFAIEDGIIGADEVNRYIHGETKDIPTILKTHFHSVWQVQELADLIDWMRVYNKANNNRLTFAGFDNQQVQDYIDALDAIDSAHHTSIFQPLVHLDASNDPNPMLTGLKATETWITLFTTKRDSLTALTSPADYTKAMLLFRNIRAAMQQFSAEGRQSSNATRDAMMAENVMWLREQYPRQKMMLWAHNGHVEKEHRQGALFKDNSMGSNLEKALGDKYLNVGFSTNSGAYRASRVSSRDSMSAGNVLLPAIPGQYEYYLHAAGLPAFVLDLAHTKVNVLQQPMPFRLIGLYAARVQFLPSEEPLYKRFDVLIHVDETHAARELGEGE